MISCLRDDIIIDMLSVERNYILVKSHLLGGPSERIMPPRSLVQVLHYAQAGHFLPHPTPSHSPSHVGLGGKNQFFIKFEVCHIILDHLYPQKSQSFEMCQIKWSNPFYWFLCTLMDDWGNHCFSLPSFGQTACKICRLLHLKMPFIWIFAYKGNFKGSVRLFFVELKEYYN